METDGSEDEVSVLQLIANKIKSNGSTAVPGTLNTNSKAANPVKTLPKEPISIKTQVASSASTKSESGSGSNSNNNNINRNNSNSSNSISTSGKSKSNDIVSSDTTNSNYVVDSDDDIPIVELVKKRKIELDDIRAKKKAKEEKEKEEDRDKLRRKERDREREREKERAANEKKEKDRERNRGNKSSSSVKRESTVSSSSSSSRPTSTSISKSQEFYETSKGRLVQKLMIRWWYSIEWPKADEIMNPPSGYEALDGFKGVFVSTRTDSFGQILDLRDKSSCPSLSNLSKKPSAELKELTLTAIKNQMTALKAAEGDDCRGLELLSSELGEIKKIDSEKADREGKRYENCFGLKK